MKQCVDPQSTKLVVGRSDTTEEMEEETESESRETEMMRELGSDKAAALSRIFGRSPLELSQPSGGGGGGLLNLLTPRRELVSRLQRLVLLPDSFRAKDVSGIHKLRGWQDCRIDRACCPYGAFVLQGRVCCLYRVCRKLEDGWICQRMQVWRKRRKKRTMLRVCWRNGSLSLAEDWFGGHG